MTEKTATFVKQHNSSGDGRVYRLDPPLIQDYRWWNALGPLTPHYKTYNYVWVSATVVPFSGPETYIFGWDAEKEEVANWSEVTGSYAGDLCHSSALAQAGYTTIQTLTPTQKFIEWLTANRDISLWNQRYTHNNPVHPDWCEH